MGRNPALDPATGDSLGLCPDRRHHLPNVSLFRSCVDDRPIAATQGINVGAVFSAVFVIGAALAGMAGVLGGVVLGVSIGLDFQMQLLALVVVIIGGLGSLKGAFVGSMLVGLLDSFSKASFPTLAYFTIFAPVVIIPILRPQGLFGKEGGL